MTYRLQIVLLLLAASLMCMIGPTGCAAWATYPPIPGALHVGQAHVEPVPSIMAEAVRYANERYMQQDEPAFNLPQGTPASVYDSVVMRLRGGRPMLEDEPAIHLQQVRVRSGDAQVDVLYPRGDGFYQLVTLYMKQRFAHKYEVRETRLWRIHVERPSSNYPVEQPQEEPAEQAVATVSDEAAE